MKQYNSLQEVYDTSVAGLASQDFKPAMNKRGECRFRGPRGRRCAIGHCIPDNIYSPKIEKSGGIWGATLDSKKLARLFSNVNTGHLSQLQLCHDMAARYESLPSIKAMMISYLRDFAGKHKLRMPKVLHLQKNKS